jgi:hypothetical protein
MHYELVVIGGLVVACLPLDPSFAGSNPAEDDEIFLHVKDPCGVWQRYYVDQMQGHFSPTLFFVTRCLCCNQRALVDEAGIIRTQMGTHNRSENGSSAREAFYDTIPYVTSNIISSMFLLCSQHHLQVKLKFIIFFLPLMSTLLTHKLELEIRIQFICCQFSDDKWKYMQVNKCRTF